MRELNELLERLKQAQRDLVIAAARQAMLPSDATIRKIADMEAAIAAVEAVLDEERRAVRAQVA